MRVKSKKVCGVGINDSATSVFKYSMVAGKKRVVWTCPYYSYWHNLLKRCYGKSGTVKNRFYKDCTVCEEWLIFSNFKTWMEEQDWEGKHLDKDLLVVGNKVYSPVTCVFIKQDVNKFMTDRAECRGSYPIGVTFKKSIGKFISQISSRGVRSHLGTFSTPEEAHQAWLKAKLKSAKELAEEILSEGGDIRVAKALVDRYENYSENNQS